MGGGGVGEGGFLSTFHGVSLTLSLLLPSSTLKDLWDYTGLAWIILDNLPILGPVY